MPEVVCIGSLSSNLCSFLSFRSRTNESNFFLNVQLDILRYVQCRVAESTENFTEHLLNFFSSNKSETRLAFENGAAGEIIHIG